MTETELEKKWENTVWDTDVYLDELDKMNDIEKRINKMIKKSEVILNAGKQTNEEWFCQLSTEEKAEWITENITVYADDWVKSDEKLLNPATWVEWLKEKHE